MHRSRITYPIAASLLLVTCCQLLRAQSLERSLDLGLLLGTAFYQGDLAPSNTLQDEVAFMRPSAGLFVRYNDGGMWAFRAAATYARLGGSDEYSNSPERNLSFRNNIFELNLMVEFLPLMLGVPHETPLFLPYLTAGVGGLHMNPETEYQGQFVSLQPVGTEGQGLPGYNDPYNLWQLGFPMGGGIRVIINDTWTAGLEFIARYMLTDYLDDVGSTTVNYGELIAGNGVRAAELSFPAIDPRTAPDDFDFDYRRGGKANDWWQTLSVTVSMRLWKSKDSNHFPPQPICPANY